MYLVKMNDDTSYEEVNDVDDYKELAEFYFDKGELNPVVAEMLVLTNGDEEISARQDILLDFERNLLNHIAHLHSSAMQCDKEAMTEREYEAKYRD